MTITNTYLPELGDRLQWAHGRRRAHRILSGLDNRTVRDQERWASLGRGGYQPSWEGQAAAVLRDVLYELRWGPEA